MNCSRIRKEWVSDPWSNCTESGSAQKALLEEGKLIKDQEFVQVDQHVLRLCRKEEQRWINSIKDRPIIQVKLNYELVTRRNRGEEQTHQLLFPISIVVFLRQKQDLLLTHQSPCIMALERSLSVQEEDPENEKHWSLGNTNRLKE